METWFRFVFQCLHSNSLSGVCISSKLSIFAFITSDMAIATLNKLIACFPISCSLNINNIVGVWLNQHKCLATQWKANKTSIVGSLKRISQFQSILNKASSIPEKRPWSRIQYAHAAVWFLLLMGLKLRTNANAVQSPLRRIPPHNYIPKSTQPPHPALLCKAVSNAADYDERGSSETQ